MSPANCPALSICAKGARDLCSSVGPSETNLQKLRGAMVMDTDQSNGLHNPPSENLRRRSASEDRDLDSSPPNSRAAGPPKGSQAEDKLRLGEIHPPLRHGSKTKPSTNKKCIHLNSLSLRQDT